MIATGALKKNTVITATGAKITAYAATAMKTRYVKERNAASVEVATSVTVTNAILIDAIATLSS